MSTAAWFYARVVCSVPCLVMTRADVASLVHHEAEMYELLADLSARTSVRLRRPCARHCVLRVQRATRLPECVDKAQFPIRLLLNDDGW